MAWSGAAREDIGLEHEGPQKSGQWQLQLDHEFMIAVVRAGAGGLGHVLPMVFGLRIGPAGWRFTGRISDKSGACHGGHGFQSWWIMD